MISNPDFEKVDGLVEWLREVPYEVLRHGRLYNAEELYQGYEPSVDVVKDRVSFADCYDSRVYQHFIKQGKIARDINESVARSMHDHGIHTALIEFLKTHDPLRCIGIMGGHALLRTDPMFASVAMLSKRLTEAGFFMVSGGGPGAMEATHLGAWMAGRTDEEAQEAIRTLAAAAASFKDGAWLSSAFEVMRRYPQDQYVSLGVPTWLYGHEPSTPFATQNHYLSFGIASPMIFMGKDFWTEDVPVYPMIHQMEERGRYKNLLLTLTDDPFEIERVLKDFQKTIPYVKP